MDAEDDRRRPREADPFERVVSRERDDDDVTKAAHGVFGYVAGKSIIATKLKKFFPTHKTYTEPFCGSAAMFFVKDPAPTEVLSDTNKEVAFAHKSLKTLTKSEFQQLGQQNWKSSRATFGKVLKSEPTGKVERLYKFLYLARFSYGKKRTSWDPNSDGNSASTVKRIERLQPRYKNATILCSDYAPVLKKYDGKDAFHFLDPPYAGYNATGIGEKEFDEGAFRKALDAIKGQFLLTYGTKGKLDTSGFEVKRLRQPRTIRTMRGVGGDQFITHLLISNFKLAKKSLGPGTELDDVMQVVDVDDGGERITVTGSRTSVSVPDDLVPARAWKNDDTLLAYPAEVGPVPGEARLRFLEKRWELDLTFPVNDVTVGWTLKAQRALAEGLQPAQVAKSFSIEGSRHFLPLTCGVPARETPVEAIAAAVVKIDHPEVELGLQTASVHEYFLSKGDELVGQLLVERDESLGEKHPWLATMIDSKFVPNAVLKGAPMPPDGVSALPESLEKIVPAEFRYWEQRGEVARTMRDALSASGFFGPGSLAMVDGEVGRVVTKFELYEPGDAVPSAAEWRLVKVAEIVPSGMELVEVLSPAAPSAIAKASKDGERVIYVDAQAAKADALEALAKLLAAHSGHYVVTVEDSPAARAGLVAFGRPFQFRPGNGVGVDAVKRLFVASFGVRGDDVRWLDKAEDAEWLRRKPALVDEPSDDSPDLGKAKPHMLVVERPDGSRATTEHSSRAAAQRAAVEHLQAHGGHGKVAIAPKGKEHTVQPLPARVSSGGDDYARDDHGRFSGKSLDDDETELGKAEWSTAYVNELPDSAFLYVEAGGEKDEEGKTKPRELRHFPYKDKDGNVDQAHVMNAIGRIPQSTAPGLSADKKEELQGRARSLLKSCLKRDKSARELLETLGPPNQWSGAAAAAIGPENRKVMADAWEELSPADRKVVEAKFREHWSFKIVKAEDEHYVLGVVLEPDVVDAQKDVYSAAEVRDAAHRYMAEFQNRGLMHKELVNNKVDILESFIAPADFTVGSQSVKKGTWIMAVRVKDAKLWNECKSGGLTGFSIGGSANRQVDPKATSKYNARKEDAKKKIAFQGIPIVIDRPKGFVQHGVDDAGKPWTREYQTDYGYIPRTKGGDGDGLDVFVGPDEESPAAFWVTQKKADGSFDEYKVMLGYRTADEAKKAYDAHVPAKFFAGMREGTVHQIKALLNQEPEESIAKMVEELLKAPRSHPKLVREANAASEAAREASTRANASGSKGDHQAAASAHRKAAGLWEHHSDAANRDGHEQTWSKGRADMHREAARGHDEHAKGGGGGDQQRDDHGRFA